MITAIMDAERVPLQRMEDEVEELLKKKDAWQSLRVQLQELRDLSRNMYGLNSPFRDKVALSTDKSTLTATATREAGEEREKEIVVKQLAMSDRFLSRSLPKDYRVEAGEYVFKIGEKEIRLSFNGGTLKQFSEAVNKKAGEHLQTSVINDTLNTQIFSIKANKTGEKNRLAFMSNSAQFGIDSGIIEQSGTPPVEIVLDQFTIQPWNIKLSPDLYSLSKGTLTLKPSGEVSLPQKTPIRLNKNMVLSLSIKTEIIPEEPVEEIKPPPGPDIPVVGAVEFQELTVISEKSKVVLPEWNPPVPPEKIEDLSVIFIKTDEAAIPLEEIKDSIDYTEYTFSLGSIDRALYGINLRNRNTNRNIFIKKIEIFDKTTRGEYRPINAVSEARDAIIEWEGIEITRPSNSIDDLLTGVTLNLIKETESPVYLNVTRDLETITEDIFTFIGIYNQIITEIDILSREDESIINSAEYLSKEEKEDARERLGLFRGEFLLNQMKSRIQTIMMQSYATEYDSIISLLAHIGISTNMRASGTGFVLDKVQMRGYLQIDDEKFEQALSDYPEGIAQIFGYDTDNDFAVDSGVAYTINNYITPFVQTGGLIPVRIQNIDTNVYGRPFGRMQKIEDFKDYLVEREDDLRRDFSKMEAALDALERSSQSIDNFNRGNSE